MSKAQDPVEGDCVNAPDLAMIHAQTAMLHADAAIRASQGELKRGKCWACDSKWLPADNFCPICGAQKCRAADQAAWHNAQAVQYQALAQDARLATALAPVLTRLEAVEDSLRTPPPAGPPMDPPPAPAGKSTRYRVQHLWLVPEPEDKAA